MGFFFERKAYIEFSDHNNFTITTPFRQAKFDTKKLLAQGKNNIDLINLSPHKPGTDANFIAVVASWGGSYYLEIFMQQQKNTGYTSLGMASIKENKQAFKAKIWET